MNIQKFYEQKESRQKLSALASGQNPHTLFITCADSRLDPALITQTDPGEIFVIRNVGNIIPPFEEEDAATTAALEFATQVLGIKKIVIMGHTSCGALGKNPTPTIAKWVRHAGNQVEDHVLKQVEHLKSYPFLNDVSIDAWIFDIGKAAVLAYDPQKEQFSQIPE